MGDTLLQVRTNCLNFFTKKKGVLIPRAGSKQREIIKMWMLWLNTAVSWILSQAHVIISDRKFFLYWCLKNFYMLEDKCQNYKLCKRLQPRYRSIYS